VRRADRLFQIVQYLRGRRLTTAFWLADKLEVSARTIYRDIQDLMCSGVPIEGEAGVGYVLRRGFDIPPLMFTKDEIEALVIGARMVKTWSGSRLARSAEFALDKIEAVLPVHLKDELEKPRIFVPDYHSNSHAASLFDDIREAINLHQYILIEYISGKDKKTERELRPLGMFFWGQVWTLAAWCELRQAYRNFRVDRVVQLSLLDKHFSEDDGITFNAYMDEWNRDSGCD
jgi:predicted DNA-binding transcriptional regulator YafY